MKPSILFFLLFSITTGLAQDGMIPGTPALAYWKLGRAKEIIIVLHGGPATQHNYLRPEFDQLSADATVIYYDQRGCGKSEMAASYTWQEHVSDLKRVIQTVSNGQQVILAGSSWGTLLALAYTLQYQGDVKGIILSGTVSWEGLGLNQLDYEKLKAREYKPRVEQVYTDTITEVRYSDTTSTTQLVHRSLTSTWGPANYEPYYSFKTAPKISSLKDIKVPVLVFRGGRNDCFIDRSYQYARLLPNAELVTIKKACHDPWLNNPTAFFAKCSAFVKQLP
ncbi:MAG TPA: alpha/beta fold hydrolase [Flavisolibacter sp.]|nr:alpha/beta fold hydrolase [Flavisolibacter sp.]